MIGRKLLYTMAKILLVEDDTSVANLYTTEFSLRGHTVQHIVDGNLLLDAVAKMKPDVVLLDIQLPTKDGLTLLKELKSDPNLKSTKVIVLSNYAGEENVNKALEIGAIDFIPKHRIVPEELGEKVESLVS
jgi:DNA-binding response OmpR family regulator